MHLKPAAISLAIFALLAPASARAQDAADAAAELPPSLTIRVTAIGGVPPERFTTNPDEAGEVSIEELKAAGAQIPEPPGGGTPGEGPGGQKIPRSESGVFMLPENPNEYPPRPLFVGTGEEGEQKFLWLTPGSIGPRFALPWKPQVGLFKKGSATSSGTEEKVPPFFRVAAAETTSHLTLILSASPDSDGWSKPRVFAIDTSPEKVPAGSTFFLNMSGGSLRCTAGGSPHELAPGAQWVAAPELRDTRGMIRFEVMTVDALGRPFPVVKTQRRVPEGDRLFVIAYRDQFASDPIRQIRLLIYRDGTDAPALPSKNEEAPE